MSYVEDEDLFNDAERLGSAFKVPNYSVFCIIINKHTNPNYLMNTLSHEVLHTVFAMMKHLGIKYSDKSEESFTYLNGYIMEEIYKQLPNE
ncbi:MAG: hypothetical protein LBM02_09785 [Lachnospiraceae bacterium]|nr:hypothetical protein [Lachnospiraceae bacterium]